MKIRNTKCSLLYDYKRRNEYIVSLKDLSEIDKVSIVSNTMFKSMLQSEGRLKYSAYLISLLVDVDYKYLLKNMKISTPELSKKHYIEKGETCDYVADMENTKLNIEMNNNGDIETLERNLEYAFRLYASLINMGSDYNYKQVIQINLNNFSFEGLKDIVTVNYIQNAEGIVLTDKIIIINIYLPNLLEKCYTKGVKSLSKLEKCLYALIESDSEKLESIIREDKVMREYVDEAEKVSKGEYFGQAYDHEKADQQQQYNYGLEKGLEQGLEKGREENKKETAINFYQNGASKELICKSLNITEEQLNQYLK